MSVSSGRGRGLRARSKLEPARPRKMSAPTQEVPTAAAPALTRALSVPASSVADHPALRDLETLGSLLSRGTLNDNELTNLLQVLKLHGSQLQLRHPDVFEKTLSDVRRIITRDKQISPVSRLQLLQLLELSASNWSLTYQTQDYYSHLLNSLPSSPASSTTSSRPQISEDRDRFHVAETSNLTPKSFRFSSRLKTGWSGDVRSLTEDSGNGCELLAKEDRDFVAGAVGQARSTMKELMYNAKRYEVTLNKARTSRQLIQDIVHDSDKLITQCPPDDSIQVNNPETAATAMPDSDTSNDESTLILQVSSYDGRVLEDKELLASVGDELKGVCITPIPAKVSVEAPTRCGAVKLYSVQATNEKCQRLLGLLRCYCRGSIVQNPVWYTSRSSAACAQFGSDCFSDAITSCEDRQKHNGFPINNNIPRTIHEVTEEDAGSLGGPAIGWYHSGKTIYQTIMDLGKDQFGLVMGVSGKNIQHLRQLSTTCMSLVKGKSQDQLMVRGLTESSVAKGVRAVEYLLYRNTLPQSEEDLNLVDSPFEDAPQSGTPGSDTQTRVGDCSTISRKSSGSSVEKESLMDSVTSSNARHSSQEDTAHSKRVMPTLVSSQTQTSDPCDEEAQLSADVAKETFQVGEGSLCVTAQCSDPAIRQEVMDLLTRYFSMREITPELRASYMSAHHLLPTPITHTTSTPMPIVTQPTIFDPLELSKIPLPPIKDTPIALSPDTLNRTLASSLSTWATWKDDEVSNVNPQNTSSNSLTESIDLEQLVRNKQEDISCERACFLSRSNASELSDGSPTGNQDTSTGTGDRIRYGLNFLLACSKSRLSQSAPPEWSTRVKDLPDVCLNQINTQLYGSLYPPKVRSDLTEI